jgi:hypothetical protein
MGGGGGGGKTHQRTMRMLSIVQEFRSEEVKTREEHLIPNHLGIAQCSSEVFLGGLTHASTSNAQ